MAETKKELRINDALLAKIAEHEKAIEDLRSRLKPTPPLVEVSLAQCNANARADREAKFAEAARLEAAIRKELTKKTRAKK